MNTNRTPYRLAAGIALAAALLLVWLSLGVGIIGADGDPANLMYAGVLAVGVAGTFVAQLHPRGRAPSPSILAGGRARWSQRRSRRRWSPWV